MVSGVPPVLAGVLSPDLNEADGDPELSLTVLLPATALSSNCRSLALFTAR